MPVSAWSLTAPPSRVTHSTGDLPLKKHNLSPEINTDLQGKRQWGGECGEGKCADHKNTNTSSPVWEGTLALCKDSNIVACSSPM